MNKLILFPHKTRIIKFYSFDDTAVPEELFGEAKNTECDEIIEYPLPFKKRECTVFARCGNICWLGSKKGLIRYAPDEKEEYDRVMYFSAERDLQDNNVINILAEENAVWVRTQKCASHILLDNMRCDTKANILLNESVSVVDRYGMISARGLKNAYDMSSRYEYHNCDNDGGFTASCCIGEMLHYAVLRREKGKDNSETLKSREHSMRMLEACLLLMFVSGRDDGFVARTYITADNKVPDDGLFLRKTGGKAVVLETTYSRNNRMVGMECDASAKIPERLTHLYRDEGYTDDDIIFKGDTSSDEITLHVMNLYYAHIIFGDEDSEIDGIIKKAASQLMQHIVGHEHELIDFHGSPTSWARWSSKYFTAGIGWGDAPLNAAEVLMYLKVTMAICGEDKIWTDEYERLLLKGYGDLPELHYDRAFNGGIYMGCEVAEDLMYGDHMLANLSFFGLMLLEKDEKLRSAYLKGWKSWRDSSIEREHHPIYDIPFAVVCPDEYIDEEKLKEWFYRHGASCIAAETSLTSRTDVPVKEYRAGFREASWLLTPDERKLAKYDRNSLQYTGGNSQGKFTVEMCSPYTFPYWMGRYYGLITEGE